MKRMVKFPVILGGVILLAQPAYPQNDESQSAEGSTAIWKVDTDSGAGAVVKSVGERASRVASTVGHKVETATHKVGVAIQKGAQKTERALQRAGQWVESKVGTGNHSSDD